MKTKYFVIIAAATFSVFAHAQKNKEAFSTAPQNQMAIDNSKLDINGKLTNGSKFVNIKSRSAVPISENDIQKNQKSISSLKAAGLKNAQLEDLVGRFQGPFYNPTQSGQGILFNAGQVNGSYSLFGAWFTYAGDGTKKVWLTVQAPLVAGEYTINAAIYETSGGRFNQPNQPNQVSTKAIGGAILSFNPNDCQSLSMQFGITDPTFLAQNNISPAQGQGTINMVRLYSAPSACSAGGAIPYALQCRQSTGVAFNYTGTISYPHETNQNLAVGRPGFGYQSPNECDNAVQASAFSNQGAVCNWNGYNWQPYAVYGTDRGIGNTNYGHNSQVACNDAVRASSNRAICNWNGNGFSVYNILNGQYVGRNNNNTIYGFVYSNECNDTVQRSNRGLVCTWVGDSWSIYEIQSNRFVGNITGNVYNGFATPAACQTSVSRATATYVCNNDGTGSFKAFRISTGQPVGQSFPNINNCWDSLNSLPN